MIARFVWGGAIHRLIIGRSNTSIVHTLSIYIFHATSLNGLERMRTREGNRSRHRTVHHPLCLTLITARTYCIAYSLLFTTHARVAVWPYGIPVQMNVDTTIGICACGAWRCSFCISHIYNFQYVCCSVELHYTSYRIIRFMLTRSITLSRPALLCFGSYRVMACRLISTSAPLQYTIHKFSVNFFIFFKRIRFNCQLTF